MKGRRGCVGGPSSAAGRHRRGACAAAGPSDFRRPVGVGFDVADFALRSLCLCAVVVGYDFGRVRARNLCYEYEFFFLATIVYCVAILARILYCTDLVFLAASCEEGAVTPCIVGFPICKGGCFGELGCPFVLIGLAVFASRCCPCPPAAFLRRDLRRQRSTLCYASEA